MKPVEFHRLARRELFEASGFYHRETTGLGDVFLSAVGRVLSQLERFPDSGAPIRAGLRKAIVPRFPYNLIYANLTDEIYILAVAHQKRRPRYWVDRAP